MENDRKAEKLWVNAAKAGGATGGEMGGHL